MNAQSAIEKVLQEFTKELLKVFSEAVLQAVSQVGDAGRAALPAATAVAVEATKRATRKAAAKGAAKAAPKARAAAKTRARAAKAAPTAAHKSTPDQVNRLGDRILETLRKASRNLGSKELMGALGLRAIDEGRFQYALNKLKEGGDVQQHGERRQARYGLGAGSGGKPRSPRVKATTAVSEVAADSPSPDAPAEG